MTSLARQLAKLAIPGQQSLSEKSYKTRASLLFKPEEASDIDIDTIHSLGLNGLEELIRIDSSFEQYEADLFPDSCKEFERTVQTKEALAEVDDKVESFLRKISPYFLLKPAQKCLEWLIRVFRVNHYNTDALMECVLPYHETNLFARVVQLLTISESSSWYWVKAVQQAGSPLSKLTLVQHCVSQPSFMVFICEMVPKSISVCSTPNRALLGLYASTIISILKAPGAISEELIVRLLPFIIDGLQSDVMDYRACSYMLTSQLSAQSSLEHSLCSSLLKTISKSLGPELVKEGVSCLMVICHTQNVKTFNRKVLDYLLRCPSLVGVVCELSGSYYTTPLLDPLLSSLLRHCSHGNDGVYLTTMISVLDSIKLEEDLVHKLLGEILGLFQSSQLSEEELRSSAAPLLQSLDAKYPVVVDKAIQEVMSSQSDTDSVPRIVALSLPHSRHQPVSGVSSTLALSVYHSNPGVRVAAVRDLAKTLGKKSISLDAEFVREALLARLQDDDPTVVAAVLSIKPKHLFKALSLEDVVPPLLALLSRKQLHKLSPGWQDCVVSSVSLLLSQQLLESSLINTVLVTILPLLFTGRHSNQLAARVAQAIADSAVGREHPVLAGFDELIDGEVWRTAVAMETKDPSSLAGGCEAVFDVIGKQLATSDSEQLISEFMVSLSAASSDQLVYYSVLGILGSCARHMTQDHISSQLRLASYLLEHVRARLVGLPEVPVVERGSLPGALEQLMMKHPNKTRGHANVLLWLVNIITELLLIPSSLSTAMWLELSTTLCSVEDLYYHCLLLLFAVVTDCVGRTAGISHSGRELLMRMTKNFFTGPGTLLRFLAMIWTASSHAIVTPVLQSRALSLAAVYIKSLEEPQASALLGSLCPVVPSLLLPLGSPVRLLRVSAVSCLQALPAPSQPLPFHSLVQLLLQHQLEIIADSAAVVEVIAGTLAVKKRRKSSNSTGQEVGVACVLGHMVEYDMPRASQVGLLRILAGFNHKSKMLASTEMLSSLLNNDESAGSSHDEALLEAAVSGFSPLVAGELDVNGAPFNLLIQLLSTAAHRDLSPQAFAVQQISPDFFSSLPGLKERQAVLCAMIDVLISSNNSSVTTAVKQRILQLPLTAGMIETELNRHHEQLGGVKPPPTPGKRARRGKVESSAAEDSDTLSLPWKRVTLILELLQSCVCHVTDSQLLVPELFSLLNRCLERSDKGRVLLEYTQQLLLACVLEICTQLANQGTAAEFLSEGGFNVELVVKCLRLSTNPQTHHQALLLLGTAASLFPGPVLHHVMPIFTFMGSSMLRHDDQYSFSVITSTIDSVIPALLHDGVGRSGSKSSDKTNLIKSIVQVFVDSLPHVPEHRRLHLLTHLLRRVEPEQHLSLVVGLIVEKQVVSDESAGEVDSAFPVLLTQQFPVSSQLTALGQLIQYLMKLPTEKPKSARELRKLPPEASWLFNLPAHSERQLRLFRSTALALIMALLSHKKTTQNVQADLPESIVLQLLQSVLQYSLALTKTRGARPSENNYWAGLLNKTYSITDKVISLLSQQSFLDIVCQLVTEGSGADIRRKALEILNSKLEDNKMIFTTEHEAGLLELLGVVVGVACDELSPSQTRQTALYSVKLLIRKLAKHNQQIIKACDSVLSVVGDDGLDPSVLAAAMLCLGEACSCLGPHAIPLLPAVIPGMLDHLPLQDTASDTDSSELLLLSGVVSLGVIIKTLPHFISSFINQIITMLCSPALATSGSVEIIKETNNVRKGIAESVPGRILLPAYQRVYPSLLDHQLPNCIVSLVSMLSTTIEHMAGPEVKVHSSVLLSVFTTALDYRSSQDGSIGLDAINAVETRTVQAFTALVVKLSESLFRPLFIQLLDWASQTNGPRERLITFYHLTDSVAGKLKGLFLLFAGHIVKNIASLLSSIHSDRQDLPFCSEWNEDMADSESDSPDSKLCQLLDNILRTLNKCFTYDRAGEFLNRERFDTFLQPLVDQVSNTVGGVERYRKRVESSLAGCLSSFAVAAGKDSLWKPLNYQLLLKTKHSNPEVRLSVLLVLQDVYLKLGEEFLVLLPETIPFLAECMEDESEEVEKLTQKVVATIERILGEPIQQYF